MRICCFFLFLLTLISCSKEERGIKKALRLAGDNREELEAVLDHYSQEPADSLKYRAAVYLAKKMKEPHMNYLYSRRFEKLTGFVTDSLESYGRSLQLSDDRLTNKEIRQSMFNAIWKEGKQRFGDPATFGFNRRWDIRTITKELLIENIDYAFRAWQLPWARQYSFDQFCRYILPYRYGSEPLEPWREPYWQKLQFVIDSMKGESNPVEVALFLNRYLARDYWGSDNLKGYRRGQLKPSTLLKGRMAGNCHDQVGLGCAVMRAMGIATSQIVIPAWGTKASGHAFNVLWSPQDKRWIDFHAGDIHPGDNKITRNPPKAFLDNNTWVGDKNNLLAYYQNMVDVTSRFNNTTDISIEIENHTGASYAYLVTFNNQSWTPVMWSRIEDSRALFSEMGCGMVYLPMVKNRGKLIPAGSPLQVDSSGNIEKVIPDKTRRMSYEFTRKYPLDSVTSTIRCKDMNGGVFQVADDSSFSNPVTLHTIKACTTYLPREIKVKPITGRYVRYVFPPIERAYKNGPGWVAFFQQTSNGYKPLRGEYLAPHKLAHKSLERVFDESLLTYVQVFPHEEGIDMDMDEMIPYRTSPDSFWVGMDLGREVAIGKIGYCPRNDKNHIYPGMSYELHYWDSGWSSLGIKKATSNTLVYDNIPKSALLLLECLDEGKEKRIFTITEVGQQIWW